MLLSIFKINLQLINDTNLKTKYTYSITTSNKYFFKRLRNISSKIHVN